MCCADEGENGGEAVGHRQRQLSTYSHGNHSTAMFAAIAATFVMNIVTSVNKKHLKNVGPIHYCEPPHAHSPGVASGTIACRLYIDVHDVNDDDNDNA